jgi:hypothetical protein
MISDFILYLQQCSVYFKYIDNTIFFMGHDLEKAMKLNLILIVIEQLSVLMINFHGSELNSFREARGLNAPMIYLLMWCIHFPFKISRHQDTL